MTSPLLLVLLLGAAQSTGTMSPTSDVSGNRVTAAGGGATKGLRDWAQTITSAASGASSYAVTGGTTSRQDKDRWSDVISANEFGADPSYSGTINRAAFQAAATYIGTRGSGRLIAAPGRYTMNGTVSLSSGTRMTGPFTLVQDKPNSATIKIDTATDVVVDGVTLEGYGRTDTASTANAAFYGISPLNQAFGVWVVNSQRVYVINSKITNHRGGGVFTWHPTDLWVTGNYITGTYDGGVLETGLPPSDGNYSQFGVCIEQTDGYGNPLAGDRIHIARNHIERVAHAVFVAPGYDHVTIEANYWGTLSQHGFYVYPTSNLQIIGNRGESIVGAKVQALPGNTRMTPYSILIANNILSSADAPALEAIMADEVSGSTNVRASAFLDGVSIVGNVLSSSAHSGLLLSGVRGANVTANVVKSAARAGMYFYQTDGVIQGNTISQSGGASLDAAMLNAASYHTIAFRGNSILKANAGAQSYLSAVYHATYGPPIQWAADKYHGAGAYVQNWDPSDANTYIYKATVGGISASSGGPTGTTAGITDGAVTWDFVTFLSSVDKGTITLEGNTISRADTEPTRSLTVGGTNLVMRSNRIDTAKYINSASTLASLEDDGSNTHGGWLAGSPYTATGGVVLPGRPGRDFMSDAAPGTNCAAPYQRRDRVWNTSPTAGGALLWDCVTVGSTWKAVNVEP